MLREAALKTQNETLPFFCEDLISESYQLAEPLMKKSVFSFPDGKSDCRKSQIQSAADQKLRVKRCCEY